MTHVEDVVRYIQTRLPDAGTMALCKLAYYTQAWHLTWEGSALYPEQIEAWKDGPVPRAAWHALRAGREGRAEALTPTERETVDAVISFYGEMTGWQLRELSHSERPWLEARGDLPEGEPSTAPVTLASMRRYYTVKSMTEKVPTRLRSQRMPSVEDVLAAAEAEEPRWKGTLTRLAGR
ncbi:Panacea domain-containing protein [Amycolatopsis sp. NPDC054798]